MREIANSINEICDSMQPNKPLKPFGICPVCEHAVKVGARNRLLAHFHIVRDKSRGRCKGRGRTPTERVSFGHTLSIYGPQKDRYRIA